ncbi:MarR family winged helix-turn-helix transcriptional regulator [Amycolatopsis acidiphila]|uniref:Winged helix-turn-helix transcriptional regulator n=1 Tax=Amycolatopsis acidiphila TaxID=715473 RepID=A0A558AGQ8_9PSEU|nr:MarR family winged helix-turn-helix transcriptional regulator [Amycolatopsis acidiphila]TVT23465.1 winged helix-turn-helix transcriptional regulator [Amycolatopsis acidiphila]UIJ59923.1 MarR family winged helix-turn-helix transcriptional regulator [Amycolatopsis acidiphila]GHG62410.1 MarR family transcriptional regulator [Amycolatopsis acidiphila]
MSLSEHAGIELLRQLRVAGQLQHAWVTYSWQRGEPGLHPAAAMLLSDLALNGESRPSELAKRKMVDVSVISRQIAQLVASGLVERRPAPEDGRAALVRVSEQGETELKRWRESYLELVRTALSDWTEEEVAALTTRLASMNDAMRRTVGEK